MCTLYSKSINTAQRIPSLFLQTHNRYTRNTPFAIHNNAYLNNSPLASPSINTMLSLLQNEAQIHQFERQNIKQASLAYENHSQFSELNHSNLPIIKKSENAFLISTKKLNALNTSFAQMTNHQKSFFAQFPSQYQSIDNSINSIQTSSKLV